MEVRGSQVQGLLQSEFKANLNKSKNWQVKNREVELELNGRNACSCMCNLRGIPDDGLKNPVFYIGYI